MATKPNAKQITLSEQIIDDRGVSGLTIQVSAHNRGAKIRIWGNFEFGNREFIFDSKGGEAGAGTFTCRPPRPTWIVESK